MIVFEIAIFEIIKQAAESQIPKAHFEILNLFICSFVFRNYGK